MIPNKAMSSATEECGLKARTARVLYDGVTERELMTQRGLIQPRSCCTGNDRLRSHPKADIRGQNFAIFMAVLCH